MEVKLICRGGKNAGQEIPVRVPKFFIGRAEDCHLRPGSPEVSRHHAAILVEEGFVAVRDFDSKNGSFVNGERVRGERELAHDDVLRIGSLEFTIERTVSVGGRKRPKAKSVEEVAARMADSPTLGDDDELDVGQWFDDDEAEPTAADSSDTQTGPPAAASSDDTSVMKQHRRDDAAAEDATPPRPSITPQPAKPTGNKSADSQSAASDTLRKLMGRRR